MEQEIPETPDKKYLFIVKLALERYSLETNKFYRLTKWKQIFRHPDIVRSAYVALDLWKTERFVDLDREMHYEAKLLHFALLNV